MRAFCLALLMALAACAPSALTLTTRTPPALVVELPTTGSVYYSNRLQVQGRASQGAQVAVRVLDEDDALIAEARITADASGAWATALVVPQQDDVPRLLTVQVFLGEDSTPRFVQSVLVAPFADRPDGVWGQILFPSAYVVLGGDEILVEGVFSGIANATLTLTLEGRDGDVISTRPVLHLADNAQDAHFWRVDLPTGGYVQPAWVRLRDPQGALLDEVPIILESAAG